MVYVLTMVYGLTMLYVYNTVHVYSISNTLHVGLKNQKHSGPRPTRRRRSARQTKPPCGPSRVVRRRRWERVIGRIIGGAGGV